MKLPRYREIWLVDTEYYAPRGHRPDPICLVAKELISGRVIRLDRDELRRLKAAPFDVGRDVLVVAYYASADIGSFLALGWPLPANVVDLYVEFLNLTNGLRSPKAKNGLFNALLHFGLPFGDAVEKREMRELARRGAPFTPAEMRALVEYCQSDVFALEVLWSAIEVRLDASALIRGDYMKALAVMEWVAIPIDMPLWTVLSERWDDLKLHFAGLLDPHHLIWEGTSFSYARFGSWLASERIDWPRLPTGQLDLKRDVWKDMALGHPQVSPFAKLRFLLSQLRLSDLSVGPDGRNRGMLSAFGSKTGRNQPSTTKFVFGLPSFLRPIIMPKPGMALAYIDWARQEFGIGGCLSNDAAMVAAYVASDPYLEFAKQAGAAPPGATLESHGEVRNKFKMVVLGVGYGMSKYGLSRRLGISVSEADELLSLHRRCYPAFWRWQESAVDHAQLSGRLTTRFGWNLHLSGSPNFRSVGNFPCQANGAEMMRRAAVYGAKEGIRLCCPVHDAFLIEAPEEGIEHVVFRMKRCMAKASRDVLDGFELKTDEKIIRHPDRFGGASNSLWRVTQQFATQPLPKRVAHP
jgi:DNA polymerase-1